jgi:RHS repeat-associated protein
VTWTDNSANEDGFQIERSPDGVVWQQSATVSANITAYADNNVVCGATYWYRARAYNAGGASAASAAASTTTPACGGPPAAPSNLIAVDADGSAYLTWQDNSNNEDGFTIERGRFVRGKWYGTEIGVVSADVTDYFDLGACGPAYRVRAYNAYGVSAYSEVATVLCGVMLDSASNSAGFEAVTLPAMLTAVPTGQIWKSYYFAGGQAIALRVQGDPVSTNNGLFFMYSDHLGSTSLTTDASGNPVARQLYDAWGNVRLKGDLKTDITFTGQRSDSYIKLVQMGARWYDPMLGRWLSPDTIVPDPTNPQSLNRYSYVNNRPLNFTDPSGHCAQDKSQDWTCWLQYYTTLSDLSLGYEPKDLYTWGINDLANLSSWIAMGVKFTGNGWTGGNLHDVNKGLNMVGQALGSKVSAALGLTGGRSLFINSADCRGCVVTGAGGHTYGQSNLINLLLPSSSAIRTVETMVHELGHIVDWHAGNNLDFSLSPSEPWLAAGNYFPVTGGWVSTDSYLPNRVFPSQYAAGSSDPREDFADTFAWQVYTKNGASYRPTASYNPYGPSAERQNALTVALDKFK